jgi:hypothetical protein
MKKLITPLAIAFVSFLCCFAQCKKTTIDSNGLPPASKEGKNTLGFLLNGKAWTPKGFNGTAHLSIDFDPGFNNGVLGIAAYSIITSDNREYFGIGMKDSLNFYTAPFSVNLSNNSLYRIRFENNNCSYFSTDMDTHVTGTLSISKLDRTARIIAGNFSAIFKKIGSDSIKITEGRFDLKY